ncbi:hypothetical protein MBLNU13_g00510t1 [Cladosporium sp. NU13]
MNTETECELLSSTACYRKHPAYTELEDRSIRLISIRKGVSGEQIHCNIQVSSLDKLPHYVTLSYAWGSQRREHEIILNGHPLLVPRNLYRFLQSCRASKDFDSCSLWIDMLSIDQVNLSERAKQVVLMPKIFMEARSVVVWLGPAYADSDTAMSALSKSSKLLNNKTYLPQLLASPGGPAIGKLCTRAYWRRLWVFQELRLGRNIRLMCGSKLVSWEHYDIFMQKVAESSGDAAETIRHSPAMRMVDLSHQSQDATLWELLQKTSDLRCSDPRDRVFAILGVTTIGHEDIEPDYTVPVPTLLNQLLNRHWKLTRPESLSQVAEQCKLAEDIFHLRRDEAYSLEGQRGKGEPTSEVERRIYRLKPENSPISLWWALFYGHTAVEQLLWSSCRYSFFESDALPNPNKILDSRTGIKFSSLTTDLECGTDPMDGRLEFFLEVIKAWNTSVAHLILNGWDSLDEGGAAQGVSQAVDRVRVHLLESMFAPQGFFVNIQKRLNPDRSPRYMPYLGQRLPPRPPYYVRQPPDPDNFSRDFWRGLILAHSLLSPENIGSQAPDISPALRYAESKGYRNIATMLMVGRRHRKTSEQVAAATSRDKQATQVKTMLWKHACEHIVTLHEDAALDSGRAPVDDGCGKDKVFLNEELELIRLFILSQCVNINAFDRHGRTPLMTAVSNNQPQLAKLFLECKACNVNERTPPNTTSYHWRPKVRMTALAIAIEHGHAEMVSLLLNAHHLGGQKVDINLEYESADGDPYLPLELAYSLDDDGAIAQLLLRTGDCYWTRADLLQAAIEDEEHSNLGVSRYVVSDSRMGPGKLRLDGDRKFQHARKFKPGTGTGGVRRPSRALKRDPIPTRELVYLFLGLASFVIFIAILMCGMLALSNVFSY